MPAKLLALVLTFWILAPRPGMPAYAAVEVAFGPRGLKSLRYNGQDLLDPRGENAGAFVITGAQLRQPDGASADAGLQQGQLLFDAARQQYTWTYPWGSVSGTFRVNGDRLDITVDVANRSDAVLQGVAVQLLALRFPQSPQGWMHDYPYLGANNGSPTVITADYGTGVLAVVNEDVQRPLLVGFPGRASTASRPLLIASYNAVGWLAPMMDSVLARPVYPGQSDTYRVSIRFGATGTPTRQLVSDIYERFRIAYPFKVKWADRRPIGALFLSSSVPHPPLNPRGWFNNDKSVDTTTDAGRARFREAMLSYVDNSIKVLKDMDAQGAVIWDIEGQEYPHATSYIGDPRSLPPEMEPLADEVFKRLRDAGLRVGICIRPQLPLRQAYASAVHQYEVPGAGQVLKDKVAYATKRWGCTLFYVDSNGDPNVPMSATIVETVTQAFPDVLLMPEQKSARYYATTAPFQSYAAFGITSTPAWVRNIYPEAFSFNMIGDNPGAKTEALTEAVRHGDILVFRGWYNDPANAVIKEIYRAARAAG